MNRNSLRRSAAVTGVCALSTAALALAATLTPNRAEACGCLSPPDPVALDTNNFAVNQQAEQIIFEVGEETVSAHVQIRYAGDPEQFAWIVPVPNVPDLELSHTIAFGMIDEETAPNAFSRFESLCPVPEYQCEYHPTPDCDLPGQNGSDSDTGDGLTGGDSPGDTDGGGGGEPPSGVDVLDMQTVGDYETVTFSADDAALAVDWLHENGFIVNETMTPYMQPYIDGGMVFVAARLVAGAGVDSIKPLKITYDGTQPMIPLQLTAVAAEPHMTVSAFIYSDESFAPVDHPLIDLDPSRIARDPSSRMNYPMVLAASIDEAGGDAFVREYEGPPIRPRFFDPSGCCDGGSDWCGIEADSQCQCPAAEWDAADCMELEGLLESIELTNRLADEYTVLTRLTTRLSPEEMTFDPMFEGRGAPEEPQGRLQLEGVQYNLQGCDEDVIDQQAYEENLRQQECTAMYCGEGSCVVSGSGKAGCDCNDGFVAKSFTDYDGLPSITCVPETGTVDLGLTTDLPDVCAGFDCGAGDCVEVGGFPTCDCAAGDSAVFDQTLAAVTCEGEAEAIGDPGANNYTGPLQALEVCAPAPPNCGDRGWLVEADIEGIHGVMCESSTPTPEQLEVPEPPTCEDVYGETATPAGEGDDDGSGSGGCSSTGSAGGLGWAYLGLLLFGTVRLRRRR